MTLEETIKEITENLGHLHEESLGAVFHYLLIVWAGQENALEIPAPHEWAAMGEEGQEKFFIQVFQEIQKRDRWTRYAPMPKHEIGFTAKN